MVSTASATRPRSSHPELSPRDRPWPAYRRDLQGAWKAIDHLRHEVDRLDRADEIAAKVSDALHKERFLAVTALQKVLAGVFAVALLAANLLPVFNVHF